MVFIKAALYKNGYEKLETDEENLQMRLCERAHSNLGAITPINRCAMGSTRQYTLDCILSITLAVSSPYNIRRSIL